MRRAFKFRLRPNRTQEKLLATSLETHRRVYNDSLALRKESWEKDKKTLRLAQQYPIFSEKRNAAIEAEKSGQEGPHWLAHISAVSMRDTIKRLDKSFDSFFKRIKEGKKPGYPRFRGRDRYDSIPFDNYNSGCALIDKDKKVVQGDMDSESELRGYLVKLFGIGNVKVKIHRPIKGKIKTVTIKREADHWYAVFSCDLGEVKIEESKNPPVGIDVGIESFFTDSDGVSKKNPRYLKKELPEIIRLSKKIALRDGKKNKKRQYCQRDSKRRGKNKKKLQRLHRRVKNLRKEHHHEVSLKLVREYGMIAVENLNILGMLGNRRLSRSIADAAWNGFLLTLKCKAESAGVRIIEVDPRGTSQQCSSCGREVRKDLKVRWHECPHCGLSLHRDHNAARNILKRALLTGLDETSGCGNSRKRPTGRCPKNAKPNQKQKSHTRDPSKKTAENEA